MSVDIKPYLQYLEKEKNIPKDEACALIAEAIKSSVEKSVLAGQNIEVIADPATGKLDAFAVYVVSDSPSDAQNILPLADLEGLLRQLLAVRTAVPSSR